MTLEEAIANRERCYNYLIGLGAMATPENVEAVRMSLEALREKRDNEMRINAALERLGYYEELEKQGRLAVLPCKLGDTVYEVTRFKDGTKSYIEGTCAGLHLMDEVGFRKRPRKAYMVVRGASWSARHIDLDKLGKTLFLTLEEVRAACNEKVLRGDT